jgi:hypothetical protein
MMTDRKWRASPIESSGFSRHQRPTLRSANVGFTSTPAVGCAQIALPPDGSCERVKSTLSERAARTNDYPVVEDTTAAEDPLLDRVVPRLAEVYEIPGTG